MFRKKLVSLVAIILFLTGMYLKSSAQKISDPILKNLVKAATAYADMKPVEKLYLQTDKPYYMVSDTIRLKAYLLNADFLTGSAKSGLLYVDLCNENGKIAKRMLLPVIEGLAWGDIILDSVDIPKGKYTLRAYTNWMRNFGDDYLFKKDISISQYENNPLLVNTAVKQSGNKVEAEMKFSLLDGRVQAFKDVEMRVLDGKKTLAKDKLVTGIDGAVQFNFTAPEHNGKTALSVKAQVKDNPEFSIPISLNRPEEIDLQFMPEGGALVAGLTATVGFKALNEDGKGVNVTGKIINSKGEEIVGLTTLNRGMGRLTFTPKAGEMYTAKLNGINRTYALPLVNISGTSLAITSNSDSLKVLINHTDGKSTYYLIAQARNVVCYAQAINFSNSNPILYSLSKSLFPTGIARFTLLNSNYHPLNERIVFINQHDQLNILVNSDRAAYNLRDSIALNIRVTDKNGKPVSGIFSMAVTDNKQVKIDSLGSNIMNNLLLTSDLKGAVEDPAYYFTANGETELDNLMLTQGWVGYDWKNVIYPKYPFAYKPEAKFSISGKVTNALGQPMEKAPVVLFASKPTLVVKDTVTDANGQFTFTDIFPVDTAIFKIQARNKRNREFNVGIEMDEVMPPEFTPPAVVQPWYVNTDTTLLGNMKIKKQETTAQSLYRGEGMQLKEVNIKAKKVINGSKNLNGPGEADIIIDEEELKKADKITLLELLQKKVIGFTEGPFTRPSERPLGLPSPLNPRRISFLMNHKEVHFVFDGIDLDTFFDIKMECPFPRKPKECYPLNMVRYQYLKTYLNYFTAEDITGIEINHTTKYSANYTSTFLPINEIAAGSTGEFAYIEITTRSKQGPFMKVTPGTYLFKTLAFTLSKQFYRPKYTTANHDKAPGTDMRSTIHWEPNVITDVSGNATVSFYSADKTGAYTVIIEGSDLNGQIGYERKKIRIK